MAENDLFGERSEGVLTSLLAGASVAEAARQHGVAARTIERWLARGRAQPGSRYGPFARSVDACREARRLPTAAEADALDEDELRAVVARSARAGNVQAARFYWDTWLKDRQGEVKQDGFDPLAEVDELARRRSARGA